MFFGFKSGNFTCQQHAEQENVVENVVENVKSNKNDQRP